MVMYGPALETLDYQPYKWPGHGVKKKLSYQFEKFYRPSLKAFMLGLIDNGCVPCCFVEGGYNQRLEYLADMPKGKCIYLFDRTDMSQARKIPLKRLSERASNTANTDGYQKPARRAVK